MKSLKIIIGLGLIAFSQLSLAMSSKPVSTGYTETKHPIVMVNGIFGFDTAIGVMDYWHGIIDEMTVDGATVYVANLQATGSNEGRGEQLISYLEELRAIHGHSKFNLIGHSYGGLSARYVATTRPDLVVSVSSMGTPHKGTTVSDRILEAKESTPFITNLILDLGDVGAFLIDFLSGHPDPTNQDTQTTALTMSSAFMAKWNQSYPAGVPTSACGEGDHAVNGIRYYSMGGVAQTTNVFDVIGDVIVLVGSSLFGDDKDHDGLVNRCSNHLGKVIRDNYYLNHVDQINHILGLKGKNAQEPKEIFRAHANRLKNAGL